MDRKIFVFQIGKSLMKNFEILAAKGIPLVFFFFFLAVVGFFFLIFLFNFN